jgi:hypothetical protein
LSAKAAVAKPALVEQDLVRERRQAGQHRGMRWSARRTLHHGIGPRDPVGEKGIEVRRGRTRVTEHGNPVSARGVHRNQHQTTSGLPRASHQLHDAEQGPDRQRRGKTHTIRAVDRAIPPGTVNQKPCQQRRKQSEDETGLRPGSGRKEPASCGDHPVGGEQQHESRHFQRQSEPDRTRSIEKQPEEKPQNPEHRGAADRVEGHAERDRAGHQLGHGHGVDEPRRSANRPGLVLANLVASPHNKAPHWSQYLAFGACPS